MKKRISFNTKNSIYVVNPEDIIYCKNHNTSTFLYLKNTEPVLISKSLKDVENILKDEKFIRPHQSYLVNLNHISLVDFANECFLVLTNQEKIPVASKKRKEILKIIKIGN